MMGTVKSIMDSVEETYSLLRVIGSHTDFCDGVSYLFVIFDFSVFFVLDCIGALHERRGSRIFCSFSLFSD
jgi:hypothetical protein